MEKDAFCKFIRQNKPIQHFPVIGIKNPGPRTELSGGLAAAADDVGKAGDDRSIGLTEPGAPAISPPAPSGSASPSARWRSVPG
jgi:hypothetical protein